MSVSTPQSDLRAKAAAELFAGTPYRPVRRLGFGGMGEVFLVEHGDLRRLFVAKVIHARLATDPQLVDRVRVEAQALGRLRDPNVVEVVDFRSMDGKRPFIVMEYLEGHSLAQELAARKPLPVLEAVTLARQIASGLAAAHELGIVHRDIKPENLFLQERRGQDRTLKILDFGVARVLPGVSSEAPEPLAMPTESGVVVGSPRYVSPEGALGLRVDHRADIYSAGLVLYMMLTGRGPFDDHIDFVEAHVGEQPAPPSRYATETVPAELDRIVLKCLKKEPNERYTTANDLVADLDRLLQTMRDPLAFLETAELPQVAAQAARPADEPRSAGTGVAHPLEHAPRTPSQRQQRSLVLVFTLVSLVAALVAAVVVIAMRSR